MSSSSDDEKYDELPKLKTKIVNKKHTRKILKCNIKEKKTIINYLKKKLEKQERKLQVLECDLEEFDLSQKINEE